MLKSTGCSQSTSHHAAVVIQPKLLFFCVHNDLVRAVDEKHTAALVVLDLSAAFDTVDHPTLLAVLQ